MTKYILIFLLLASPCYGAEFLINNRESHGTKEKGDIVAVRADGYKWSESELPKVIKIKGMKYEDAVKYEQSLYKDEGTEKAEQVKHRKYKVPNILFKGNQLDTSKVSQFKIADVEKKTVSIGPAP